MTVVLFYTLSVLFFLTCHACGNATLLITKRELFCLHRLGWHCHTSTHIKNNWIFEGKNARPNSLMFMIHTDISTCTLMHLMYRNRGLLILFLSFLPYKTLLSLHCLSLFSCVLWIILCNTILIKVYSYVLDLTLYTFKKWYLVNCEQSTWCFWFFSLVLYYVMLFIFMYRVSY